jgi:hypothetical protein
MHPLSRHSLFCDTEVHCGNIHWKLLELTVVQVSNFAENFDCCATEFEYDDRYEIQLIYIS